MSKVDIPENWALATVGDIITIKHGFAFDGNKFRESGDQILLTPGNFYSEGGFKNQGIKTKYFFGKVDAEYILKSGSLLLAMTDLTQKPPGILGAPAFIPPDGKTYLHNQRIGLVNLKGDFNLDFLFWFFNTNSYRYNIAKTATGATVRHTSPKRIYEVTIAIPPLGEQGRIVSKIKSTQEKIKAIEESVSKTKELIGKYRESLLQRAFRGQLVPQDPKDEPASKLLNRIRAERDQATDGKKKKTSDIATITPEEAPFEIPQSWEWVRLNTIFKIGTGATPRTSEKKYYHNGSIPWVRTTEVQYNTILETDIKITQQAVNETNAKVFKKGSLLMAMYGEGKTRGQVAILGIDAATNQACAVMHDGSPEIEAQYIFLFLQSIYKEIRTKAEGGTQANLNLDRVGNLLIPLPPANEQKRIVLKVVKSINIISDQLSTCLKTKEVALSMMTSLLHSAFSGNLVPQNAKEGTGHELLEKLRKHELATQNPSPLKVPKRKIKK